ncbi:hypothetical protein NSK_001493 [Nannochloropsis salina CCMP1776]|jgi:hypothetical protein|uniref:Trafficking protein particle complex subunit 11 domain-containing protein n=1 Tax=Nannochloropsis salina CCMP1776 TaxID=1027361 RepID=A0A4D9D618_9STRA|nr:hypothetical protein NSK_001493 [Nannochloropsis salina CCMP1776]|eukprot:TFJ87161.1 hypothetical protein NSK_001493 [Nannochloropsis salina CCMP1776]
MLDSVLTDGVWKEAQPVLSIQGEVDWAPDIHDVFIRALHAVSLEQTSSGSTGGALGTALTNAGLGINTSLSTTMVTAPLNGIANVPFRFLSLSKTVVFPPKKQTHALKAADGRPLEGYTVQGVFKQNWIRKHVTQLPSAAILLAPFDDAWSMGEWTQREHALLQDMERLRQQVGPRDVRIFIVLVQRAASAAGDRESEERLLGFRRRAPPAFEANKMVYVLQDPKDLSHTAPALRRLYKHVRDLSSGYYFLHGKRVKRWESTLNRHAQLPLIARYRLKQAFWYEFMGHAGKALKHFRKTFDALLELQAKLDNGGLRIGGPGPRGLVQNISATHAGGGQPGLPGGKHLSVWDSPASNASTPVDADVLGGWTSQVKGLAEIVNFKICYYCMRETAHGDAFKQFRLLMQTWVWGRSNLYQNIPRHYGGAIFNGALGSSFPPWPSSSAGADESTADGSGSAQTVQGASWPATRSLGPPGSQRGHYPRLEFMHLEWVARQQQIFAELLQLFPRSPSPEPAPSTPGGGSAGDQFGAYVEPDHFFFNAALFVSKQRELAGSRRPSAPHDGKFAALLANDLSPDKGPRLSWPLYVGGRPRLTASNLEGEMSEADLQALVLVILEREEARSKPHTEMILRLLTCAVTCDPSRPVRSRFRGMQHLYLANELMGVDRLAEAWPHYCAALRRYTGDARGGRDGCGGSHGWSLLTTFVLLRMRMCALMLGKCSHYLDLTAQLLSNGLRESVREEDRRLLFQEVLYLVCGLRGRDTPPSSLESVFSYKSKGRASLEISNSGDWTEACTYNDAQDDSFSSCVASEPTITVLPDAVDVAVGCAWRQLFSFSLNFLDATAAIGSTCLVLLRLVSHLPSPVRASQLHLSFNKAYIGTICILEDKGSALMPTPAEDRLRRPFAGSCNLSSSSSPSIVAVDMEHGVARVPVPLLFHPDEPLDIQMALPLVVNEAIEIGDMLHAVQLQLVVDPASSLSSTPPLECSSACFSPLNRALRLNMPSGVAYLDNFGIMTANLFKGPMPRRAKEAPANPSTTLYDPATQPSSLSVPLQATIRGFPAVEIIRPTAQATLCLSDPKEAEEQLVTTLVGHMHCLLIKVESHGEILTNPMLYLRSDPPALSYREEDALFFNTCQGQAVHGPRVSVGGRQVQPLEPSSAVVPLKLGEDMQPGKAIPILSVGLDEQAGGSNVLGKHSSILVPVWVRPVQEGRLKINMALVYHSDIDGGTGANALAGPSRKISMQLCGRQDNTEVSGNIDAVGDTSSNLLLASEYIFDIESYAPFLTAFDAASPYPASPSSVKSKFPGDLQVNDGNVSEGDCRADADYTFYTDEQVLMRFLVKAVQPFSLESSSGGGRLRIEQVIWYPVGADSEPQVSDKDRGRILYCSTNDVCGRQNEHGMQSQDTLSLTFPFLCPGKECNQALPLGRMRLYWRVMPSSLSKTRPPKTFERSPGALIKDMSTHISWVSCTEVECPSVGVVAPDVTVHMQVPPEATVGRGFRLSWTLCNRTDRPLALRVTIKEEEGGNPGLSTEGALLWSGARERVIHIVPAEAFSLSYCMVSVLTGPIALPRLLISRAPGANAGKINKKGEDDSSGRPPLRVAYRFVDNVLSNAALLPSTPSSVENSGAASLQSHPCDTRHIFVFPQSTHYQ